jgi:hypothetical protein
MRRLEHINVGKSGAHAVLEVWKVGRDGVRTSCAERLRQLQSMEHLKHAKRGDGSNCNPLSFMSK